MTSPQPRPNVSEIPAYVAGKPPKPVPGLTTYKLSSNENPFPPLPGVVEAAVAAAERMNRYPDMGSSELYDALSSKLGVPVEDLALATGSVALNEGSVGARPLSALSARAQAAARRTLRAAGVHRAARRALRRVRSRD